MQIRRKATQKAARSGSRPLPTSKERNSCLFLVLRLLQISSRLFVVVFRLHRILHSHPLYDFPLVACRQTTNSLLPFLVREHLDRRIGSGQTEGNEERSYNNQRQKSLTTPDRHWYFGVLRESPNYRIESPHPG